MVSAIVTQVNSRHNGTYHLQQAMQAAVGKQLDVGLLQPSGKTVTCPICITAKTRRTVRPLPSDIVKRAQHPWQDVSVDLSGKMRTQGITNVYYFNLLCATTPAPRS